MSKSGATVFLIIFIFFSQLSYAIDLYPINTKFIKSNSYELNKEYSAKVGMPLYISPMTEQAVPAFKALEDFQPPKAWFTTFGTIRKDAILIAKYYVKDDKTDPEKPNIFACRSEPPYFWEQPKNGSTPVHGEYCLLIRQDGVPFGTSIGLMSSKFKNTYPIIFQSIENVRIPLAIRGEIKQELIYGGKSGSTIKISYREFTSTDLARPAFSQELTYDIAESKQISFRSLIFEIIQADNNQITYKIISY